MILRLGFLALLGLQGVYGVPSTLRAKRSVDFVVKDVEAFAPATELKTSDRVLKLKESRTSPRSSRELLGVLAADNTPLHVVENGAGYAVDITVGSQDFSVVFDTGSSDLWLFQSGFQCVGPRGRDQPESFCDPGPVFKGQFPDGEIANQNFNISYGDGEFAIGTLGYDHVTAAGVTIAHQEFALIDSAYFVGDGTISGIFGFAYPSLTSAYTGTNPAKDNPNKNNIHYRNFLANAIYISQAIDPIFSVVIERSGGESQVTLGGLPSNLNLKTKDLTSTPIKRIEIHPHRPLDASIYTYYTIRPTGLHLSGSSTRTNFPAIVDTGTTLLYLPTEYADIVNSAYDPPSQYIRKFGVYENVCDAVPPSFAVVIGGKEFFVKGEDLLPTGKSGRDPTTGLCISGVQPNPAGFAILGDVFLKNVVAVFDVGAGEMRFAAHENY